MVNQKAPYGAETSYGELEDPTLGQDPKWSMGRPHIGPRSQTFSWGDPI